MGMICFSATCPGLFRLDAISGEISVAQALDRDVAPLKDLNGLCIITIQVHVLFYKHLGLAKTREQNALCILGERCRIIILSGLFRTKTQSYACGTNCKSLDLIKQ